MARNSEGGLLRAAERTGLRKGVNGSKGWFYVGTGLWTLRTVRRLAERKPELLISERIEPGQRLVITNGRMAVEAAPAVTGKKVGRRQRKADAKARAKAAKAANSRKARKAAAKEAKAMAKVKPAAGAKAVTPASVVTEPRS